MKRGRKTASLLWRFLQGSWKLISGSWQYNPECCRFRILPGSPRFSRAPQKRGLEVESMRLPLGAVKKSLTSRLKNLSLIIQDCSPLGWHGGGVFQPQEP